MVKEIYGKKIGMTQIFDEEANLIGVTLIEIEPALMLEKVSYPKGTKARIGCFKISADKVKKIKKPILGYFNKLEASPYKLIKEVDIEDENNFEPKKEVGVDIFKEGEVVCVRAKSKGKGFQGGVKRYGWHGGPRTHGSMTHRRIGSAGATTYPGRIIKGIGMPGHMGNSFVTVKNIKVLKVDKEKKLIFLKGAIPGVPGSIVSVKKA